MIISIDHGNKQIKTLHRIFTSGLIESDTKPPFGDDILHYRGKYYCLGEKRIPYMRDKTTDDRFFILTFFAIAYEISAAGLRSDDDIEDIELVVGLPPAHYGAQYERFEAYFMDRGIIDYEFNNKPYSVYISAVKAIPQAYAAAMTVFNQIRELPKTMVVDIGGFTADYLQIKKAQADLTVCDSLENGVIILYNSIIKKVNADLDILLDESDIDAIIAKDSSDYPEAVGRIVDDMAKHFIDDLIGKLRERMIDLRIGKTVFVGGGSILLRSYIERCDKIGCPVFVEDIAANVKGYELLYRASKRR